MPSKEVFFQPIAMNEQIPLQTPQTQRPVQQQAELLPPIREFTPEEEAVYALQKRLWHIEERIRLLMSSIDHAKWTPKIDEALSALLPEGGRPFPLDRIPSPRDLEHGCTDYQLDHEQDRALPKLAVPPVPALPDWQDAFPVKMEKIRAAIAYLAEGIRASPPLNPHPPNFSS